jgi:flavin-dependent dehydrogenase
MRDVIIIGGGLAGCINAILLARQGLDVVLFEKNKFPFHRVCGEYVSNEVVPFLKRNGLFYEEQPLPTISKLILSSTNGRSARLQLDQGGFGISRYTLDNFLIQKAKESGVEVHDHTKVDNIAFDQEGFTVKVGQSSHFSKLVIGAYGKRSNLDRGRQFMNHKSPFLGVKYHINTSFPDDSVALHNFEGGYCGISKIEGNQYNLCYLTQRKQLLSHKTIPAMEQAVLHRNPYLKEIWDTSDFLFDRPLVINEISFAKKQPVENHILMSGDTTGTITPLCGNGMAMAIRSAYLLSQIVLRNHHQGTFKKSKIEDEYTRVWNKTFAFRLWTGRQVQQLFGSKASSNIAVKLAKFAPVANQIVKLTHGRAF